MITYLLELLVTLVFMILVSKYFVRSRRTSVNVSSTFWLVYLCTFIRTTFTYSLPHSLALTLIQRMSNFFLSLFTTSTTWRFCNAICLSISVYWSHCFQIFSSPSSLRSYLVQFFAFNLWPIWVVLSILGVIKSTINCLTYGCHIISLFSLSYIVLIYYDITHFRHLQRLMCAPHLHRITSSISSHLDKLKIFFPTILHALVRTSIL